MEILNKKVNTQDEIPFNFTYYALKLLGHNLYTNPWTAVSELVANGIDAKATKIKILIDITNKNHAQIEILDNGYGMNYEDLCDKYTLIGRNKRLDNPKDKTILGRKGIGKLAALYLSSKYYLMTKTETSKGIWGVDIVGYNDSDIPKLKRIETKISASCFDLWNECTTGTLIKLCDVDMRKIGEARLKALPVILSDYYLSDIISCSIEICILDENNKKLNFSPISKHISFETMFGIFDNTGENYLSKIPSEVYITKKFEIPAAVEEKCKTYELRSFENTSGVIRMQNLAGEVISANYQLDGWIAIHCSLDSDVLKRNNPNYNKTIYHPNALRLYVRGKLAVDNLMTYLGSTQAFSNYIEGEIRFDVLDDDRFEDISTSSREGYKKDDPRIEKLLEIVGKIVTRLMSVRINARDNLNKLVDIYNEEQQQKKEAEKRLLAEQLQESQRQVSSAIAEKERVETEIKKERKRIDYIIGVSNVKDNNILPSMHSVYNLALLSKKKISKLEQYVHELPVQAHNILENLGETNNQILYISKAISKANYLVDSERKKIDLSDFFAEYVYRIGKKLYGSKIKTNIQDRLNGRLLVTASPLMLSSILENMIGNSIKAKAENFIIEFTETDQFYRISFIDDGKGLDPSITDINRIFEFGVTTTSGAGLGLFYVKKYISEMEGELTVTQNETKGLTFTAIWRK